MLTVIEDSYLVNFCLTVMTVQVSWRLFNLENVFSQKIKEKT